MTECPVGKVTTRARSASASAEACFGQVIWSRAPSTSVAGQVTRAAASRPPRVAIADPEIGQEQVGLGLRRLQPAHQRRGRRRAATCRGRDRKACAPGSRCEKALTLSIAANGSSLADLEQRRRYLHRIGGADHHQARDPCRRARRRLERDQRAHAVADQRRLVDAGRVEQGEQPVGERLDARERRPGAAPVAGQVEREHRVAVVREPARQQGPDAVVVQRAVDEDDRTAGWRRRRLPPV